MPRPSPRPGSARRRRAAALVVAAVVLSVAALLSARAGLAETPAEVGRVGATTPVSSVAAARPAAPPAVSPQRGNLPAVGIAAGSALHHSPTADVERQLDDYVRLGARWLRHDFAWDAIEPAPDAYAWTGFDSMVAAAEARGINVIATLGYTPPWANGGRSDHRFAPASPASFADYAGAVAARYGPRGVHAYEIWNEPNIGYWQPRPDPAAYARVLCAAHRAITAADPAAIVISGGISPAGDGPMTISPHTWMRALYAAGAKPCFDAIGVHPYVDADAGSGSRDPGNPWFQLDGSRPSVRSIQAANRDSAKRIWATEVGSRLSVGGGADQARRLRGALARWRTYPWAGVLNWFTYWDPDEYGLVDSRWVRRPAWFAYRAVAATYR